MPPRSAARGGRSRPGRSRCCGWLTAGLDRREVPVLRDLLHSHARALAELEERRVTLPERDQVWRERLPGREVGDRDLVRADLRSGLRDRRPDSSRHERRRRGRHRRSGVSSCLLPQASARWRSPARGNPTLGDLSGCLRARSVPSASAAYPTRGGATMRARRSSTLKCSARSTVKATEAARAAGANGKK